MKMVNVEIAYNGYDADGNYFFRRETEQRPAVFSESGEVHGYGSERYKWVSRLTKEEREIVKNDGVVFVEASRKSGGGNGTGTYYRQVTYTPGYGYGHRVPLMSDDEINSIRFDCKE